MKTLDFALYNDGNGAILDHEPTEYETERIKHRIVCILTEQEQIELEQLQGCARTLYARDIAIRELNQ